MNLSRPAPRAETLEARLLLASFGPDLRFGDEGVVPAAGDVAIDALPGGQLLLIGTERIPPIPPDNDDNGNKTTLARVNKDGSLDPAFGTGGKVDLGETNGAVYNGSRVYVTTPGFDFAELVAYTPQGQLDTTFSGDGRMPVPFANPGGGTVSFVFGRPDAALDDGDVL